MRHDPSAGPALAPADVMVVQTAVSLERLMLQVYEAIAKLAPADELVRSAAAHHTEHARLLNERLTSAGAKPQTAVNPKYAASVTQRLAGGGGLADALALALTLEDVTAQTYVRHAPRVSDAALRVTLLGIGGVEARHKALLLAARAGGGAAPAQPDAAALLPDAVFPVDRASPAEEGAVK